MSNSKELQFLDLFSGVGGFALGLERAGIKTSAFVEIDKECQENLRKNFPNTPIFSDVKSIKVKKDGFIYHNNEKTHLKASDIDGICGGFPCQDISVAGLKQGFIDEREILSDLEQQFTRFFSSGPEGRDKTLKNIFEFGENVRDSAQKGNATRTRSGLWEEYCRIIKEVKPRFVLIENVANLRTKGLNEIIKDLWKIGYVGEWHIISARSVGAVHLRERLWLIAHPDHARLGKRLRAVSEEKEQSSPELCSSRHGREISTNANHFRFWRAFASEEEAQRWWAKTTSSFSNWKEVESIICGVDDGFPDLLDRAKKLGSRGKEIEKRARAIKRRIDKVRRTRIKQMGNALVPQIPEMFGRAVLKWINEEN